MAKKKHLKKKASSRRRRSRVGAVSGDNKTLLTTAAFGIVGAIGGAYIESAVTKMAEKSTSTAEYAKYLGAGAQLALGYILPKVIKQDTPMIKGAQMGLLINGGLSLVKALDILPGVGAMPFNVPMIAGTEDRVIDYRSLPTPQVAGYNAGERMRQNYMKNKRAAVLSV